MSKFSLVYLGINPRGLYIKFTEWTSMMVSSTSSLVITASLQFGTLSGHSATLVHIITLDLLESNL